MKSDSTNNSTFAITANSSGEPSKLYTPVIIMNPDKVIIVKANAMWDTGAEICVISKKLADLLQLDSAPGPSVHGLTGSSGSMLCFAYISLVATGGIITVRCAVVDGHVGGLDYSVIFGLNLIRMGTLAITGGTQGITLSFKMPATDAVDFTLSKADVPHSHVTLSDGREKIELFTGIEAVRLMNNSIPKYKEKK